MALHSRITVTPQEIYGTQILNWQERRKLARDIAAHYSAKTPPEYRTLDKYLGGAFPVTETGTLIVEYLVKFGYLWSVDRDRQAKRLYRLRMRTWRKRLALKSTGGT